MNYVVVSTENFDKIIRKHKKNSELLNALENKIARLEENPHNVGGRLSGNLHGKNSTRLVRKFRLIFQISDSERKVYLLAIDHRSNAYD